MQQEENIEDKLSNKDVNYNHIFRVVLVVETIFHRTEKIRNEKNLENFH